MAAIRNKDTKLEKFVRSHVHAAGFRFRLHRRDLPGRPDLVFPRYRLTVFVNGCFWHGHGCSQAHRPRKNAEYWQQKIEGNVMRDQRNARSLDTIGWEVFSVWGCTVEGDTARLLRRLGELRNSLELVGP